MVTFWRHNFDFEQSISTLLYYCFYLSKDTLSTSGFNSSLFCRCASPPECEQSLQQQHRQQEQSQRESGPREGSSALTPMMRALIELEETRATESRAPCKNSPTTYSMPHTHSQALINAPNETPCLSYYLQLLI